MNRTVAARFAALLVLLATSATALAHNSRVVADGRFRMSVGLVEEPIHTDERNGLDLAIRRAGEKETVPGLEAGLNAEIVAPDGTTRRPLPIRPRYQHPGRYTADIVLTRPGIYRVRVWGTLEGTAFDETFELNEARPLSELRFP
ncbi:MAG: hypothetical protein ACOY37_04075 [Pseudomonadota bacterium]